VSELSDKEILIMMTSKCADLEHQLKKLKKAYNFNLDLLSKQKNELEEAREALVKSNSQLDLTWYAISSSTDIYTKDKIKTIYKNELDKLKEKGECSGI